MVLQDPEEALSVKSAYPKYMRVSVDVQQQSPMATVWEEPSAFLAKKCLDLRACFQNAPSLKE